MTALLSTCCAYSVSTDSNRAGQSWYTCDACGHVTQAYIPGVGVLTGVLDAVPDPQRIDDADPTCS